MPLYNFKCKDCSFNQEHFVYTTANKLNCPQCSSENYQRLFSKFRVDVHYANNNEYMEKKFNPELQEMYQKIGREALNEDSQTLDNLFGEQKVQYTYGDSDE